MELLHFLRLQNYPIFQQLQLEEALLRADHKNWCLVNVGSPPAIVLGISGDPEKWVDSERLHADPVPLIRRFSGGGTVFVDEQTLFVTFICSTHRIAVPSYPESVLRWSASLYSEVLHDTPFRLIENDYAMGDRKCGGNAQYFRKERWLHHTSWLWDFHAERMRYLRHPPRMPCYREGRSHEVFLCRLKEYVDTQEIFITRLLDALRRQFYVQSSSLEVSLPTQARPHRKTTQHLLQPELCHSRHT